MNVNDLTIHDINGIDLNSNFRRVLDEDIDSLPGAEKVDVEEEGALEEGDLVLWQVTSEETVVGRITDVYVATEMDVLDVQKMGATVEYDGRESELDESNTKHGVWKVPESTFETDDEDDKDTEEGEGLTAATDFEIVAEEFVDKKNDRVEDHFGNSPTLDRWQKHGKDRLYFTDSDFFGGSYVDLQDESYHTESKRGRRSELGVDGDTLTITIEDSKRKLTLTIRANGIADE